MYADREGLILLSLFQKSRTIKELGASEQRYLGSDDNIGCSATATILCRRIHSCGEGNDVMLNKSGR